MSAPDGLPQDAKSEIAVCEPAPYRPPSDTPFLIAMGAISGAYVLLLLALLLADMCYTSFGAIGDALRDPAVRYSVVLSLISCTITAILSLWVAVPLGYLLSRQLAPHNRNGRGSRGQTRILTATGLIDTILDVPIVLPPLVLGISLLILFRFPPFKWLDRYVTYEIPAVILAQFTVACAFAVRTMRVTFDQINPRCEQVALTLGCSRGQAFWHVVLPEARRGIFAAGTLAWARALGEFGPIMVFAGATRMHTEVLSTTVFLELSIGHLETAVAVSLLMLAAALVALISMRMLGLRDLVSRVVDA